MRVEDAFRSARGGFAVPLEIDGLCEERLQGSLRWFSRARSISFPPSLMDACTALRVEHPHQFHRPIQALIGGIPILPPQLAPCKGTKRSLKALWFLGNNPGL
jgi:hypothetical protein